MLRTRTRDASDPDASSLTRDDGPVEHPRRIGQPLHLSAPPSGTSVRAVGARALGRDLALPWASATRGMLAFRWLVVACLAATLAITWPLWQVHASPPMLPALPLPAVDTGSLLLGCLALVLLAPPAGIALTTLVLSYAMSIDQLRLQPEVVSLAILLLATLPGHSWRMVGRAHLVSLWIWAGVNKLLSPGFMQGTAQWLMDGLLPDAPPWLRDNAGYLIGGAELTVGILAIVPRTRVLAGFAALALHGGILLDLSPVGHDWNMAVWPWNVALAFAGLALIAPWRGSLGQLIARCPRLIRASIVILLIAPLGFYFGVVDAYLAHNLYSSNTPGAKIVCPVACRPGQTTGDVGRTFHVPMPPERRLFQQLFLTTCQVGDQLVITDPRWWFQLQGQGRTTMSCPTRGIDGA